MMADPRRSRIIEITSSQWSNTTDHASEVFEWANDYGCDPEQGGADGPRFSDPHQKRSSRSKNKPPPFKRIEKRRRRTQLAKETRRQMKMAAKKKSAGITIITTTAGQALYWGGQLVMVRPVVSVRDVAKIAGIPLNIIDGDHNTYVARGRKFPKDLGSVRPAMPEITSARPKSRSRPV